MSTFDVAAERTAIAMRPGRATYLPHPLNQGDKITLTLDWTPWLGSDAISSATYTADDGISVSNTSTSSPNTTLTLTAASNAKGTKRVEIQITTTGSQIRTGLIVCKVVDLR